MYAVPSSQNTSLLLSLPEEPGASPSQSGSSSPSVPTDPCKLFYLSLWLGFRPVRPPLLRLLEKGLD